MKRSILGVVVLAVALCAGCKKFHSSEADGNRIRGTLEGYVKAEGNPVAGAVVAVSTSNGKWSTTTDANGWFKMPMKPGIYHCTISIKNGDENYDTTTDDVAVTDTETGQEMDNFDITQAEKAEKQATMPTTDPPPAPASDAPVSQATTAADDSCFDASTDSREQDRIDLAQTFREGLEEHGVTDPTWMAIGDNHRNLAVVTSAPSWSPQVQRAAQEWSTTWRRNWFQPKLQKAVCDAGFSRVAIIAMIPKSSGGKDFHLIYKALVTKRGFVAISATD